MNLKSICGIILISEDPPKLADFYGKVLGVDFEREDHGDLEEHFGVDVGQIHFGIHPPSNFRKSAPGNAASSIAFEIESLDSVISTLEELGAEQVQPPHDEGFGPVASYLDPDGNLFEIVELTYEFD